jgi:hypothetical protein
MGFDLWLSTFFVGDEGAACGPCVAFFNMGGKLEVIEEWKLPFYYFYFEQTRRGHVIQILIIANDEHNDPNPPANPN